MVIYPVRNNLAGSFAAAESQPEQGGALGGSPWINSTLAGNLPGKAPAAVDDFYLSVNYDELQQFIDTYGVTEGDGMYIKPEDRLNIWGK